MYRRLNITLPDDVVERADTLAARERYTRSGLIAAALEAFIAEKDGGNGGGYAAEPAAGYGVSTADAPVLSIERVGELMRAFFSARDDIEAAWVFGSVARGAAGRLSDVDVAVLPKGRPDPEERWELRMDLASRLPSLVDGCEVDVAVVPDVGVGVGHRMAVEGVRVFGQSSSLAAEVEIRALSDFWDFEPVRRMLRDRLRDRLEPYARR